MATETRRQACKASKNISARLCGTREKLSVTRRQSLHHHTFQAMRFVQVEPAATAAARLKIVKTPKSREAGISIDQARPTVNQHGLRHRVSAKSTLSPARLHAGLQNLGKPPVTRQVSYRLSPTTTSRLISNPALLRSDLGQPSRTSAAVSWTSKIQLAERSASANCWA